MIKEDCLSKYPEYIAEVNDEENTPAISVDDVKYAMDEWALRFGKWLQGCGYVALEDKEDTWTEAYGTLKTTEELYQLFLKLNK